MEVKSVDPKWLCSILSESGYMKSNNLEDVEKVELKAGCGAFENFGSQLKRLTVTFKTTSGEEVTKSIILKAKRVESGPVDVSEVLNAFPCETKMYKEVLYNIGKVLESKGEKCAWAKLYGCKESNILLEDLSEQGFELKPKTAFVDYHHGLLGIRQLATLHALSVVIIQRGLFDPTWFKPSIYARHIPFMIDLHHSSFNGLIKSIKKDWEPEWQDVADKVIELRNDVGTKLQKLWERTKGKFDVINHGDFWVNNLLFKYDKSTKVPVDIRLIDFQCCHYNSPCWDLAHFLYGSMLPEHMKDNKTKLLEAYIERFQDLCKKFDYSGPVPDLAYVQQTLKDISYFCFMLSCMGIPFIISNSMGTFKADVDNYKTEGDDLPSIHTANYQIERVREIMKGEVKLWTEYGLIK